MSYAFWNNWRAFLGYRVVGVANVALADNQFLPFLADTAGLFRSQAERQPDSARSLHGRRLALLRIRPPKAGSTLHVLDLLWGRSRTLC